MDVYTLADKVLIKEERDLTKDETANITGLIHDTLIQLSNDVEKGAQLINLAEKFTEEILTARLSEDILCLIYTINNEIKGFGSLSRDGEIRNSYILKEYRGIGGKVNKIFEEYAKSKGMEELHVEVIPNPRTQKLCEIFGYEPCRTITRSFGLELVEMRKRL